MKREINEKTNDVYEKDNYGLNHLYKIPYYKPKKKSMKKYNIECRRMTYAIRRIEDRINKRMKVAKVGKKQ